MADYTDLPNTAVGVGGIPSGTTVTALRDNPIAIAERATGAPKPIDDYELLTRTVIAGTPATIDFTFDPTLYDRIDLMLGNVSPSSDGANLFVLTSANSGSTFHSSYSYARWRGGQSATASTRGGTSSSGAEIALQVGSAANEFACGKVSIYNPQASNFTQIQTHLSYENLVGELFFDIGSAFSLTAATVNAVRLTWSAGNFDNGAIITAYGVRNS